MKRFLSMCMCIFIFTISVITYIPVSTIAADTDFTLSIDYNTVVNYKPSLSSSEAHSAVMNHGDIYGSDHQLIFQYTPTSSYNWSFVGTWSDIRMSDKQLETFLQCSNPLSYLFQLYKANASNNPIIRTIVSSLGAITSGSSDLLTSFYDTLTSNVNYLNAIEYDSSTGDLTLLADKVDSLKNNLLFMYRKSIHAIPYVVKKSSPAYAIELNRSNYEYEEDYVSDWQDANLYDYAFSNQYQGCEISCFNKSDFSYIYISNEDLIHDGVNHAKVDYWSYSFGSIHFVDGSGELVNNLKHIGQFDSVERTYCFYDSSSNISKLWNYNYNVNLSYVYERISNDSEFTWGANSSILLSKDGSCPYIFNSYEAMYNYSHGSQDAYLASKIFETGEDIKLSINDMNDNIGSKIDDLIDSINNKKEGMSADELQDAIDKALDSISGKIDEIGDNTQQTNNKLDALLESVSGTNQILMQILGVTTDIRDIVKTTDEDGNQYTMSDVSNCFNTMFNNLKYAVLYGKNNVNGTDDSGASDDNSNQSGNNAINTAYVMNSTGLLCTLSGRSFSKCNPGDAFVGIYCKSDGYCGPILVSEDSRAVSYETEGRVFDYTSSIAYANKTWYVSAGDYFMPSPYSSEGYATVISTDRLTPSDAALLLLQKAGVTENTFSSNASNADNTTSDIGDKEIDYKDGLLGKFPFSVPYQLYEWLQILQADEKVPQFTYNYGFLINHKGDTQYDLTIDLSDYQPWADVLKSFLRLSFTLCMSVFIYNKFKGEM